MSFKREGDDPDQLGVLQKRRVADLLANYIPEDEALLLRSGRYACTVCAHRPVFDTLDVLTVHRAGKKHTSSKWGTGKGGNLGFGFDVEALQGLVLHQHLGHRLRVTSGCHLGVSPEAGTPPPAHPRPPVPQVMVEKPPMPQMMVEKPPSPGLAGVQDGAKGRGTCPLPVWGHRVGDMGGWDSRWPRGRCCGWRPG
uniref:Sodium channel modifier 1 n=1 Tax=Calidris pygmaea TaxID=425635 RepID=A0A8C3J0B3_9CHAR